MDYSFEFKEISQVINFLKLVPDNGKTNGIDFNYSAGEVILTAIDFPNLSLTVNIEIFGDFKDAKLAYSKIILNFMLVKV